MLSQVIQVEVSFKDIKTLQNFKDVHIYISMCI